MQALISIMQALISVIISEQQLSGVCTSLIYIYPRDKGNLNRCVTLLVGSKYFFQLIFTFPLSLCAHMEDTPRSSDSMDWMNCCISFLLYSLNMEFMRDGRACTIRWLMTARIIDALHTGTMILSQNVQKDTDLYMTYRSDAGLH